MAERRASRRCTKCGEDYGHSIDCPIEAQAEERAAIVTIVKAEMKQHGSNFARKACQNIIDAIEARNA